MIMKKKMYESPEITVVKITPCSMLATSNDQIENPDEDDISCIYKPDDVDGSSGIWS